LNGCGFAKALVRSPEPRQRVAGRLVTGTFRHIAEALLTLHVEGLEAPIQCTPRHPFWSVDRHDFVEAGDLKPHERLLTNTGETVQVLGYVDCCDLRAGV
jgi:hypothetical protein